LTSLGSFLENGKRVEITKKEADAIPGRRKAPNSGLA